MTENVKVLFGIGAMLFVATFMVAIVWAKDNPAVIDHFFHFHLDEKRLKEEIKEENEREERNKEIQKEWVQEIESVWTSQDQ